MKRQLEAGARVWLSPIRRQLAVGGGGSRVLRVPCEARVNPLVAHPWDPLEGSGERPRIDQPGEAAVGLLVWKPSYVLTITRVLLVVPVEFWLYLSISADF